MKLFFNLSLFAISISAQNQPCMDKCGAETDKCHSSCSEDYEWNPSTCHEGCYYYMCRCFKGCGCPECCEENKWEEWSLTEENKRRFSDDIFDQSQKIEVSQFLRKKSYFGK